MSLMSSKPFLSGREMSSRIKSSAWLTAMSMAARALSASAPTFRSFSLSINCASPVRIIGWSSTMSTRLREALFFAGMLSIRFLPGGPAGGGDGHARAATGISSKNQCAANHARPGLHDAQAHAFRFWNLRRKTHAVINDAQDHPTALLFQSNKNPFRPPVLDGVGNRLLRQPEQMCRRGIIRHQHRRVAVKSTRDAEYFLGVQGKLLQGGHQPSRFHSDR